MAYDYIKRAYGKEFLPGMMVSLDEYKGLTGTVRRTRGDPQYVSVEWLQNGKLRKGDFHPDSLTII